MMDVIDTSVLIAAIVESKPFHVASRALVVTGALGMYGHGICETFSTLTGGKHNYLLSSRVTAELLEDHSFPAHHPLANSH